MTGQVVCGFSDSCMRVSTSSTTCMHRGKKLSGKRCNKGQKKGNNLEQKTDWNFEGICRFDHQHRKNTNQGFYKRIVNILF
jgi:hypothetical protein